MQAATTTEQRGLFLKGNYVTTVPLSCVVCILCPLPTTFLAAQNTSVPLIAPVAAALAVILCASIAVARWVIRPMVPFEIGPSGVTLGGRSWSWNSIRRIGFRGGRDGSYVVVVSWGFISRTLRIKSRPLEGRAAEVMNRELQEYLLRVSPATRISWPWRPSGLKILETDVTVPVLVFIIVVGIVLAFLPG